MTRAGDEEATPDTWGQPRVWAEVSVGRIANWIRRRLRPYPNAANIACQSDVDGRRADGMRQCSSRSTSKLEEVDQSKGSRARISFWLEPQSETIQKPI